LKAEDIKRVLIIGGGTMGRQIALHFAMYGCNVVIYDIQEEFLTKALSGIQKIAGSYVRLKRITREESEAAIGRIKTTTIPEEAAEDIDLVSESVPEDPVLKGNVFSLFHSLCPPRTIFTTNTSTLLPSMFAEVTGRPEKFLALHFHDLRTNTVVDIMPHAGTDEETIHAVQGFAKRMGLIDILLRKENSGYVFNAMFAAFLGSAQTLAANDIASIEDIDRAWMGVMNMPIGPFGIMDSVGIATAWMVTAYWAKQTGDAQSQKNADFLKQFVDRGELGQKTGKGFYQYPGPLFRQPGFIAGKTI
jgi:3-hydroxybutyryl-CoA dehydrogenase